MKTDENETRLIEMFTQLLTRLEIDKRYYGYVEAHRSSLKSMMRPSATQIGAVMSGTSLTFKHTRRENLYSHVEQIGAHLVGLKISFAYATAELVLYVDGPNGTLGGPVHSLAKEISESRTPPFSPDPPYPRLPFANAEELKEAVQLAVSLFHDLKREFFADEELRRLSEKKDKGLSEEVGE